MPSISIDRVASGKRFLSQGSGEHVGVGVEDRLPGQLAGVEHEAEVAGGAPVGRIPEGRTMPPWHLE